MNGKLVGVGVGPGDPELLTLKAVRRIREADVIVVPGEKVQESIAYQIASGACPEIARKNALAVSMPMIREREALEQAHEKAAAQIRELLEQGQTAVFLTLGDPTIYSTYLYVHRRITDWGYETEIVNGIPSFCAAAAKGNTGLVENQEMLHIIPASGQIEGAMELGGTRVFMKAGRKLEEVKRRIRQAGEDAWMIENCGMEKEKIYQSAEEIPEQAGYYSLIIVKERGGRS